MNVKKQGEVNEFHYTNSKMYIGLAITIPISYGNNHAHSQIGGVTCGPL